MKISDAKLIYRVSTKSGYMAKKTLNIKTPQFYSTLISTNNIFNMVSSIIC